MKKYAGHIDWYILIPVIGLMLFSIAFVYSGSSSIAEARFGSPDKFFWNQTLRVILALIFMFIFSRIDYHVFKKYSFLGIIIATVPLVLVFIIGTQINNAYRWLYLGPINFQPSELAKFALMFHIAALMTERDEILKNFKYGLLPILGWIALICGLIALQPNFSTSFVVFLIAFTLLFIGRTNFLHLLGAAGCLLIGSGIYAISAEYRMHRLLSYLGLAGDITYGNSQENFQAAQALIAFGSGGVTGLGPGQSRQSHLFLPESYGDFIYSIIGEEYGIIGTILILLVFAFIFWRGFKIIRMTKDMFGYYLASGILITFAYYVIVSCGVNCGLFPTTGLPLPFISYGGTAILFYGAAMGTFLNISAQTEIFPYKK